ncbi:S9 family peptidase [Granulicella cerasi]|uniref:S9 family peptidase n=1 Tax=Granulicella cerasi TaxID=741063 RepID=A0ABW1Z9Q4_9BACT|nr:S9 family peptidase [Granulicella cerasi]
MKRLHLAALLVASVASAAFAQKSLTDHDYAQAERWMGYNVRSLVHGTVSDITYLPDGRVFFRVAEDSGARYYIADPAKSSKELAFDHVKLAAALNTHMKNKVAADHLSLSAYKPEVAGFAFEMRGETWHCDTALTMCHVDPPAPEPVENPASQTTTTPQGKAKPAIAKVNLGTAPRGRRGHAPVNISPDKKLAAFIRDHNLWVRTIATGLEKQLTFDGIADYGYATDNAGWQHTDAAILTWSADSKMIATFQQDQRKTGMMYLVSTTNRHPTLEQWRYPLVGDEDVTKIEPVVIDVASAKVTRIKTEPLEHRSMECDDVSCDGDGRWNDVEFSADDAHLAFVATSRDHKDEWVRVADLATGAVREVYHEHVPTYYGWQSKIDWKYLPSSNELLWVSERSDYAQIYLYDLTTGKLKNVVTHGDGPVQDIPYVDEKARVVYFVATGKEKAQDPYLRNLYRVNFDGKGQTLLTSVGVDHAIDMAPDGKTFVDTASTVSMPQTYTLRDNAGKEIVALGKVDVSALVASGWKAPMLIDVKARDGKTSLYGFLYRPTNFDAAKKYPVVDYVYPGPQDGGCGGVHNFNAAHGDHQSLAELGFVVVCIDGQGNPHRSKSFHDAHASTPEEMGDDTIPDQVSGIKDLAKQFAWVDANNVGIWGHSGGGNATVSAMFHSPEFFKVGWAESGNHDNRDYEDDWDERWAGLEVKDAEGHSNYDKHANQNYADQLRGKLMLVHGTMDDNVPPSNSLLVADALMKANKDFDMIMVPNARHGYGEQTQYIMRRRWDYFVKNLMGATPPKEYKVKSYQDVIRAYYADR